MVHENKEVKTLSVITVTLNCVESIKLTLDSVAGQSCRYVEHVVIDGGSTDGTVELVERANVAYFLSEPDEGIYEAMEKGVKAASGDALMFLNAGDTFYDKSTCEGLLSFFNETGADIVFGDFLPYLINPSATFDHRHFTPDRICKNDQVRNRACLKYRNIHHQAVVYRRHIFDTCSFFSDDWPAGSDYELNVQALVQQGFSAKYLPATLSKFALGGVSTSDFQREQADFEQLNAMIRRKYFSVPLQYAEDEYVYRRPGSLPGYPVTLLKRSPPYRLARRVFERISQRIAAIVRAELVGQGWTEDALRDFRMRSDSIYQIAMNQNTAIVELCAAIEEGLSCGQSSEDSMAESTSKQRDLSGKLARVLGTPSGVQPQRTSVEAGIGDVQARTDSIYELLREQKQVLSEVSQNATRMIAQVERKLDRLSSGVGVNLARVLNARALDVADVDAAGYQINSQFDEDGIIQHIVRAADVRNRIFVEFGVENYTEANTRLLLEKDNWSGLVIDSDENHIAEIMRSQMYWRYDLRALTAFVSRENINELISSAGIAGDIGLLSIDIDGMDYWVWEKIDVVSPRIVVCEYNAIFGCDAAVVVPYRPDFDRTKAHYSNLYTGASLAALERLGRRKGYSLVASNCAGNNAFFVRSDSLNNLKPRTARDVYVKARFRESRDEQGNLTFLSIEEGLGLIENLPVVDLSSDCVAAIRDVGVSL